MAIIEVYGDYWHRDDDPEERIKRFRQLGYQALILWERNIKNLSDEQISNRIKATFEI